MLRVRIFLSIIFLIPVSYCKAQEQAVYSLWKDDTLQRKNYYDQSVKKKESLFASIGKDYAKDYKEIYNEQFTAIRSFWQSTRPVTASPYHPYLQSIVQKIISANPELKGSDARVVFSRDWWPNAVSMGDGTIAINAGLVLFMNNEAELAFVICHELAHYYLEHTAKAIDKYVKTINNPVYQSELKRLSKEEFRVGQQLDMLEMKMIFSSRSHSRVNETEADRQAFLFLKKTGYDCNGIISCLQLLGQVDDSSIYKPLVPESIFNFRQYPFKKKWIQKESVLFGELQADDSPLNKKEKDSLRTHPDCDKRIALLKEAIEKENTGRKFIENETLFRQLKKDLFAEITEQEFRKNNLTRNLYYSMLMLQQGDNIPLAVYSVARNLNTLYVKQREHRLGNAIDKEQRNNPDDYNLLLRMVDRWKLEDIASLNYFFCKQYESHMSGNSYFLDEMNKAQQFLSEHKPRN